MTFAKCSVVKQSARKPSRNIAKSVREKVVKTVLYRQYSIEVIIIGLVVVSSIALREDESWILEAAGTLSQSILYTLFSNSQPF